MQVETKQSKNNSLLSLFEEDAAAGDEGAAPPDVPLAEDPDQVSV